VRSYGISLQELKRRTNNGLQAGHGASGSSAKVP
jgi:hypothetical protein